MSGLVAPTHGVQAFWGLIQGLTNRIAALEVWQRQVVVMSPGVITQWGGAGPPAGALLCNGATFSAPQYPQLAAVLGGTTLPTISTTPITVIWT